MAMRIAALPNLAVCAAKNYNFFGESEASQRTLLSVDSGDMYDDGGR
jgi:hypothetical protein